MGIFVNFRSMRLSRAWLFGLGLLALSSCLKTREVDPPVVGSSDWVSPTDYTILLENFETSIAQRNVQNFLRCFILEGYRFVPSTPTYTGNEILWDNWNIQDEQNWFGNVIADLGLVSGNSISFDEADIQSFSSDSLRYIGDYDMRMNHRDTSLTVRFKGQLEFLMRVNAFNEWEIARWIDYETSLDSSLSRLKLNYVQ